MYTDTAQRKSSINLTRCYYYSWVYILIGKKTHFELSKSSQELCLTPFAGGITSLSLPVPHSEWWPVLQYLAHSPSCSPPRQDLLCLPDASSALRAQSHCVSNRAISLSLSWEVLWSLSQLQFPAQHLACTRAQHIFGERISGCNCRG